MISGHRVSEKTEAVSICDFGNGFWFFGHALEEGWVMNVGGGIVPGEEVSLWCLEVVPSFVSCHGVAVEVFEELWLDNLFDYAFDDVSAWPDVSEEHVLSVRSLADWLGFKIDVASSSKAVGNYQWW